MLATSSQRGAMKQTARMRERRRSTRDPSAVPVERKGPNEDSERSRSLVAHRDRRTTADPRRRYRYVVEPDLARRTVIGVETEFEIRERLGGGRIAHCVDQLDVVDEELLLATGTVVGDLDAFPGRRRQRVRHGAAARRSTEALRPLI